MKKQSKRPKRPRRTPAPHPSDDNVRVAAMLSVMRHQLEMFERATCADQTLAIEPEFLAGMDRAALLPGVTAEQVIARCLVGNRRGAVGSTARGIAAALGLPRIIIEDAIEELASGARVDWTPRRAVA